MRKQVSMAMALAFLVCIMAIPIQASAENENATSIKSGEAVLGSPAFKNPEDYLLLSQIVMAKRLRPQSIM